MKKLFLLLIPTLAFSATEPVNVNTANGHVKKSSSGVGNVGKPFDFRDVEVVGVGASINSTCEGRLTTESNVAVSVSDRTSQSTIYFTPYAGNHVSLYSGTDWSDYTLSQISKTLSGLTSGKNYDVFIFDNAGTLTLELSAAWTTDNAPADAIVSQDGIPVKSANHTRRWIGTIRTTSTTTTEDSSANRFVWNAFHQVSRSLARYDAADGHTYSTATWREWRNGTGGPHKVYFVTGAIQTFNSNGWTDVTSGNGTGAYVSFGLNQTTAEDQASASVFASTAVNTRVSLAAPYQSALGFNTLTVIELASGGIATFSYYRICAQILD